MENLYLIVGPSAGALIGLQFILMALIAGKKVHLDARETGAFLTPTVVQFGVVLLLSAIISARSQAITAVAIVSAAVGVCGMIYTVYVFWLLWDLRLHPKQTTYKPGPKDLPFYVLLPFVAYAALAVSASVAHSHIEPSLLLVAAAVLVLLFVGIHNAWDAVVYHGDFRK